MQGSMGRRRVCVHEAPGESAYCTSTNVRENSRPSSQAAAERLLARDRAPLALRAELARTARYGGLAGQPPDVRGEGTRR